MKPFPLIVRRLLRSVRAKDQNDRISLAAGASRSRAAYTRPIPAYAPWVENDLNGNNGVRPIINLAPAPMGTFPSGS
jgi:hypothetical protein